MPQEKVQHTGVAAVILAAGKGTRMKSNLYKVMHRIAGRPMISHVVDSVQRLKPARVVTVIAPEMDKVKKEVVAESRGIEFAVQQKQNGTGDAVKAAASALKNHTGPVLILYGDTPLITTETLQAMLEAQTKKKAAIVVLGLPCPADSEYGRLVINKKGELEKIVEFKDANKAQRAIKLGNSGVMCVRGDVLFKLLAEVTNNNAKKEYYLTDIVAIGRKKKLKSVVVEADPAELLGINSRVELAEAEAALQNRLRRHAMENGATLIAPETVYFSMDTKLGQDVIVHPNVVFGPKVQVGSNVTIRPFCHLEGAKVGDGAIIGPFARLRPGAVLAKDVHIGNFVEVKQAMVETGAKINHLSYIGDARVGEYANIGAGTITCNYDGYEKHRTDIGKHAFIGSNSSLVAPIAVGDGAIVGAGSVVTEDVEGDALAMTRPTQIHKPGWAKAFRNRVTRKQ